MLHTITQSEVKKAVLRHEQTTYNLGIQELKEKVNSCLSNYSCFGKGYVIAQMMFRESYINACQIHTIRVIVDELIHESGDYKMFIDKFVNEVVFENGFIRADILQDRGFEIIKGA